MPYPTSVDPGGLPIPWIINSEVASAMAVSGTLNANNVYLYAFEIFVTTTISGGRWRMGVTVTGTTDMGIYDVNGNLLVHFATPTTNIASNTQTTNFATNYTLVPGLYYMALCPSNATDTYLRTTGLTALEPETRLRTANNTGTSGALPATLGGVAPAGNAPSMALMTVGGLP